MEYKLACLNSDHRRGPCTIKLCTPLSTLFFKYSFLSSSHFSTFPLFHTSNTLFSSIEGLSAARCRKRICSTSKRACIALHLVFAGLTATHQGKYFLPRRPCEYFQHYWPCELGRLLCACFQNRTTLPFSLHLDATDAAKFGVFKAAPLKHAAGNGCLPMPSIYSLLSPWTGNLVSVAD